MSDMSECNEMAENAVQEIYRLSSYDYPLPEEQIAQQPAKQRDLSRLLVLDCLDNSRRHTQFETLYELLGPGDLLVVNNTKVFPARLFGRKETSGKVEMLLLQFPVYVKEEDGICQTTTQALIKSSKRPKLGSVLHFSDTLQARVEALLPDGKAEVRLFSPAHADLEQLLEQHGEIPLPPYIKRPEGSTQEDALRYQTKYARHIGSVAAPTAGLHLSNPFIKKLRDAGIGFAEVTLHVGYGTFAPVRCEDIRDHTLHKELIRVPEETAEAINTTRENGGKIWAVGTTTARTLEFAAGYADKMGRLRAIEELCGLYIYPGYRFKIVDNLITNFHLPKSSLLFMVAALAGKERLFKAYEEAVERGYRFFSYGDAMAIITKK
ncbi:MAG: tRNA preQ1(34) S-adenosylmethionine ribosyltransferase-isomerase QueA [Candidatus Electrothrix sp. GW3-4]|uniref:tRNA preQ1(34) S-adenosylmethionine ribosyltransferase-isomerase QueA n=1 Tax=Candidatus Electrothrix sp. GW3-4 TaxID=3126740 RepID=UPI0030D0EED1